MYVFSIFDYITGARQGDETGVQSFFLNEFLLSPPGTGHYITALRQADQKASKATVIARLQSPVLTSTLDYCLTFYLHHVGDSPPVIVVHAEVYK